MSELSADWRVTYTPGAWLVLAGPTMVAVLQPVPAHLSDVVNSLWGALAAATSLDEQHQVLVEFGLDRMPDVALLHLGDEQIRGHARGAIDVVDSSTGSSLLDGAGAFERRGGAGEVAIVVDDLDGEVLWLPLAEGAVTAATVRVSRAGVAPIVNPVADVPASPESNSPGEELDAEPTRQQWDPDDTELPPTETMVPAPESEARAVSPSPAPVGSDGVPYTPEYAVALVKASHGDALELRTHILVGRAPDQRKAPEGAEVFRVPSPSSDISRNHLLITAEPGGVRVTDMNSTNGTRVVPPRDQAFVLAQGRSARVELGTILDLGDEMSLRIEAPRR